MYLFIVYILYKSSMSINCANRTFNGLYLLFREAVNIKIEMIFVCLIQAMKVAVNAEHFYMIHLPTTSHIRFICVHWIYLS